MSVYRVHRIVRTECQIVVLVHVYYALQDLLYLFVLDIRRPFETAEG
jgi:hypothetical protein